jgi:hypothetical protein
MSHHTTRTQSELSDAERQSLRCVVAHMIPASAEYGVPGADDDTIFADIVASLDRETDPVCQALARLDELCGRPFAAVAADQQCSVLDRFRKDNPALAAALIAATVRCYYRDDRIMRSLGMEPRPPFPKGFDVAQGDWSLLDPVRARGRVYRDAP